MIAKKVGWTRGILEAIGITVMCGNEDSIEVAGIVSV